MREKHERRKFFFFIMHFKKKVEMSRMKSTFVVPQIHVQSMYMC